MRVVHLTVTLSNPSSPPSEQASRMRRQKVFKVSKTSQVTGPQDAVETKRRFIPKTNKVSVHGRDAETDSPLGPGGPGASQSRTGNQGVWSCGIYVGGGTLKNGEQLGHCKGRAGVCSGVRQGNSKHEGEGEQGDTKKIPTSSCLNRTFCFEKTCMTDNLHRQPQTGREIKNRKI